MPLDETEWSLQKHLTTSWLQREPVLLAGEELFLAAWEMMTDYRINDSRRHWNAPSIDFVFLDRVGCMVLVELKREVRTPRESWSVVCQVTHRAHELAAGYRQDRLEGAYFDRHSGADGRTTNTGVETDLAQAHADTFKQPPLEQIPGCPARRLVMAKNFGPAFAPVLSLANTKARKHVVATLGRYKPRGEIKRYLELPLAPSFLDAEPIRAVTVMGVSGRSPHTKPEPYGRVASFPSVSGCDLGPTSVGLLDRTLVIAPLRSPLIFFADVFASY